MSTDDGTVNSTEVITEGAVRAEVQERVEENLVFRQAFDGFDATGANSNTVEIPVADGSVNAAGVVSEGSSYTMDEETFSKISVSHDKYGTAVELTYEAIQDSAIGEVERQLKARADALAEGLDDAAWTEISNYDSGNSVYTNLRDDPIGDAGGTLDFSTVVDAMAALEGDGYSPDLLIVGAQGKADLMKDDKFVRATEMGDDVRFNGQFGEVAGLPVVISQTGDLGAGEGILVDTSKYGVESVRSRIETEQFEKPENDKRVIKARTRRAYKALDAQAGVYITA